MKKRILIFGDSNVWGYIPGDGQRFPEDVRWAGILKAALGEDWEILEDGVSARTTCYDDLRYAYRNGEKALGYTLAAQAPLDLVVLSLGTNDLKYGDARSSRDGMERLLRFLEEAEQICPLPGDSRIFPNGLKILIVSPITIHPDISRLRPESSLHGSYLESTKFAQLYRDLAKTHGVWFLDGAAYAQPSRVDCVHMSPESHLALGQAVGEKIREIFLPYL